VNQVPNTFLSLQLQQNQQPYSQGLLQVLHVPQQLQLSTGSVVMRAPQVLPAQQYDQPYLQAVHPQQQLVYIAQQQLHLQQPAGQNAVQGPPQGCPVATPQWQQQQQVGAVAVQPLCPQQQQQQLMPGMALQQQVQLVQSIQLPQQHQQHPGYVVLLNSAAGLGQAADSQQAMWSLGAPHHHANAQGASGSAPGSSSELQLVNVLVADASGGFEVAGMGAGALAVAGAAPPSSAAPAPIVAYDLSSLQAAGAPAVGTGSSSSVVGAGLLQLLQAPGSAPLPSPTAVRAGSVVSAAGAVAVVPGGLGHMHLQQEAPQPQLILQQLMQQLGLGLQEPQ
jgi:hypothetical protein